MTTLDDFLATIPPHLHNRAAATGCAEAGFGAGPGCSAGRVRALDPPAVQRGQMGRLRASPARPIGRTSCQAGEGCPIGAPPWAGSVTAEACAGPPSLTRNRPKHQRRPEA